MSPSRSQLIAGAAILTVSACGGGSTARVAATSRPAPQPSFSADTTPSAATAAHHRRPKPAPAMSTTAAGVGRYVTSSSPAPAATTAPRPKPTTASPKPVQKTTSPTQASCSATGTTYDIQEVSGDRFDPATKTIHRCDSIRAVYADTTGIPHTFTGPGWDSGQMDGTRSAYTYRFVTAGTFNFYCSYHKSVGMTGTITVLS